MYAYLYIYESSVNLIWYLYLFWLNKLCLSLSLSQCWIIVNWTLGNTLQWNFNQNTQLFCLVGDELTLLYCVPEWPLFLMDHVCPGSWSHPERVNFPRAEYLAPAMSIGDWFFPAPQIVLPASLPHREGSGKTSHMVTSWKHFPHCCPFVKGIHRSPVDSLCKGQVTRNFNVFFGVNLNKLLHKQWSWRSCEPLHSCDVTMMTQTCSCRKPHEMRS